MLVHMIKSVRIWGKLDTCMFIWISNICLKAFLTWSIHNVFSYEILNKNIEIQFASFIYIWSCNWFIYYMHIRSNILK